MSKRKYSAAELFHFYITDQHWLHMDKDKMLMILMGIRQSLSNAQAWDEAYTMIRDSAPEQVRELRREYYRKYGQPHELRNFNGRHKVLRGNMGEYAEIIREGSELITVNQN